jgi:hypothetical protein
MTFLETLKANHGELIRLTSYLIFGGIIISGGTAILIESALSWMQIQPHIQSILQLALSMLTILTIVMQ